MKNKTLIVATVSYAGMGPYVTSIINSFSKEDPVLFFLVDNKDNFFQKNINSSLLENCVFYRKLNNKFGTIKTLFISNREIQNKIKEIIIKNNISQVHFLTNEIIIRGLVKWFDKNNVKLLFTVHDLRMHDSKKLFYKKLRQIISYHHVNSILKKSPALITNSIYQKEELIRSYPNKKIYYHSFPTLVTDNIKTSKEVPLELKEVKNYVLFFGRIEYYKGIHKLYNIWIRDENIKQKYPLVIAGAGDIYFPRQSNEENIIFINRYIKDEEIAMLYKNAICSVYPYISATQSGVLSLSCYFNTPIIASDVPFFQQVNDEKIGLTYRNKDKEDLIQKLNLLLSNKALISEIKENQNRFYNESFSSNSIRNSLISFYNNI